MSFTINEKSRGILRDDLQRREASLKERIHIHNTTKPFNKKETYSVQGFDIKGITLRHAKKRLRKYILAEGFNPDVTAQNFLDWYDELEKPSEEE